MIHGESVQEIKRKYKELKESLEDANRKENPIEIKMAQEEYDEFLEFYYEYFSRHGRVKTFKTESKKIRDRIAKNMKEALNEIRKYDDTDKKIIWNHFNDFLGRVYASSISYCPNPDIDWQI
jgi:xylose isomerase